MLKPAVRYFSFFHQMMTLKNYEKCFWFHLKSFFRSQDILVFVLFSLPYFPPVSHCLRRWSKIYLKVYDAISWLNKNLKTNIIWHLEAESRPDIETWSIDRVLNNEHLYGKKNAENVHQMLLRDSFLIQVNSPQQLIHARNSFENKIFWNRIIKNP